MPDTSPADQFSDDEMHQVKRFGEALGGKPTPFDEEFEQHYARHEANAKAAAQSPVAETPADTFGQHEEAQKEAIANVSDFGAPPVIPSAPKKPAPMAAPSAPLPPSASDLS